MLIITVLLLLSFSQSKNKHRDGEKTMETRTVCLSWSLIFINFFLTLLLLLLISREVTVLFLMPKHGRKHWGRNSENAKGFP